jgi:hypothetical protein
MTRTEMPGNWVRRHWFVPLLVVLLAIETAFARTTDWSRDGLAEIVILFDLCLFIPLLYLLCYRRLARKPLLLRAAALALAGIYIASKLVPPEAQTVLGELVWARYAGLAALALIELWVVVLTVKLVYGGATTDEIARTSGAPPWIVRLLQIEARFWKAVWRFLSGRR